MSLRLKLGIGLSLAIVCAVGIVVLVVSSNTRATFARLDQQRTAASVAQFHREFDREAQEVGRRTAALAAAPALQRVAVELASGADRSQYTDEARQEQPGSGLDFLEIVAADSTIISSASWPARFGYKEDVVASAPGLDWDTQAPFLARIPTPDGSTLAFITVRTVRLRDQVLYVVGGSRLDRDFLAGLVLPEGTRTFLYRLDDFGSGTFESPFAEPRLDKLMPLVQQLRLKPQETDSLVYWTRDPAASETVHSLPLLGRKGELIGLVLMTNPRRDFIELTHRVRETALVIVGVGIFVAVLLSGIAAARFSRPIEELEEAAGRVSKGDYGVRVTPRSHDEIGRLAESFNQMTGELLTQRERLVQSERVAAWRELARRLAHELKNPLFPLQITVENLIRARERTPAEFDEVFRESAATLLTELNNLKNIVGRFSDFSKMPTPSLQRVDLNDLVRQVVKVFEPQWNSPNQPRIQAQLALADSPLMIDADPELLHRAISNLILNAMDAMPNGGRLSLRTSAVDSTARLEISDSGVGLTPEECERLFTPYYTTKQHGTGLGLAIVQSVVSDHNGHVSVSSKPGEGATFIIELPRAAVASAAQGGTQ